MASHAAYLSQCLAQSVEAVCRYYLPGGKRRGRYWIAGDVTGAPGQSLYVRLAGPHSGPGAAGKWADAATGEHGDLLDLIARNRALPRMADVFTEARAFLSLPQPRAHSPSLAVSVPQGSCESARRLFAASQPIAGTLAQAYLRSRGLRAIAPPPALRFHPRCYYRPDGSAKALSLPALIAAVTDLSGAVTGVHRIWLTSDGAGKAAIETPRRAMGQLLGHSVRFGASDSVLAAGEGIETVLSLREALPTLPLAAALSANHLAAILFPPGLRVLYILRDADPAGDAAAASLSARARAAGITAVPLSPVLGDFNDDLCRRGLAAFCTHLLPQLLPEHGVRLAAPRMARG